VDAVAKSMSFHVVRNGLYMGILYNYDTSARSESCLLQRLF
jgi:hypothetical protein